MRRIECLKPLTVSLLTQRRGDYAPFGLNGGSDGAIGHNALQRAGSQAMEQLAGRARVDINCGDTLTIETPGGGGWSARIGREAKRDVSETESENS